MFGHIIAILFPRLRKFVEGHRFHSLLNTTYKASSSFLELVVAFLSLSLLVLNVISLDFLELIVEAILAIIDGFSHN